MKTPFALTLLAVAFALPACKSSDKADRYAPPPNDGSAPANSADVVDNPSITTGQPKFDKPRANGGGSGGSTGGGSANAASAGPDVVDRPSIVAPVATDGPATITGQDVVDRPDETSSATAMKGFKYIDPVTDEPITGGGHIGYYGSYEVRFQNADNAKQWAALPRARRAVLAAPQVLAEKGITNRTCPLTGETLTAAAAPVRYEVKIIGFATVTDANQFRALKKEAQAKLIAQWRAGQKP